MSDTASTEVGSSGSDVSDWGSPREFGSEEKKKLSKIATLFRNKRLRTVRRKEVLTKECKDSNLCFLLNRHTYSLKKYFYDFNFLTHLTRAKRFNGGENGKVYKLEFDRGGYHAEAVLKNASQESDDNLFYEYLAGRYVNTMLTRFPCFIETYNLFRFDAIRSRNSTDAFYDDEEMAHHLRRKLTRQTVDLTQACVDPLLTGLLVQYVPNNVPVSQLKAFDQNMWGVLMQIYFPLATLASKFAHNDLIWDNILMYEVEPNSYITYHYHVGRTVVKVNCQYLVKIIDYSRCFTPFFQEFKEEVRRNPNCRSKGFTWFAYVPHEYDGVSDLRPLALLKTYMNFPELRDVRFYPEPDAEIGNVLDALDFVQNKVQNTTFHFVGTKKIGDMHVYTDKDYVFEKARRYRPTMKEGMRPYGR
jgi:hypothetical protein